MAQAVGRWRMLVPTLTCLAAAFLMTLPLVTPMPALPHLVLLGVLVWSLFQPSLMPPYVAFPIGIVTDAVLGLPLGINATLMPLLAATLGAIDRRIGVRPYGFDWAVAAIAVFLFQWLSWLLLQFVSGELPFGPLLIQASTTMLAYPIAVAAVARIQRKWVDA